MISDSDINNLAELARLSLTDEEREKFKGEITEILSYVDQVQSVDADGVSGDHENVNTMREDKVTNAPGEFTETLLAAAPERDGDFLKIHKILSNDE